MFLEGKRYELEYLLVSLKAIKDTTDDYMGEI